nr:hypothetical protein [uncultured Kingella sp.]
MPNSFAHGALAARRHFATPQPISFNAPFGDEPSLPHFGFQAALSSQRQPEIFAEVGRALMPDIFKFGVSR